MENRRNQTAEPSAGTGICGGLRRSTERRPPWLVQPVVAEGTGMSDRLEDRVEIRKIETPAENWYPLRKYTFDYRRRDGTQQRLEREVYFNGPGAAVLLTRQFRLPAYMNGDAPRLVEACAGNIEPGDDPTETVRKEAEQETGYRLRDLHKVMETYMSPGASAEKLHLYIARYDPTDRPGEGGGVQEEGEEIEILELPLAQAWRMVESGEITDAKTVLLLQHALLVGFRDGTSNSA